MYLPLPLLFFFRLRKYFQTFLCILTEDHKRKMRETVKEEVLTLTSLISSQDASSSVRLLSVLIFLLYIRLKSAQTEELNFCLVLLVLIWKLSEQVSYYTFIWPVLPNLPTQPSHSLYGSEFFYFKIDEKKTFK